MNQSTVSAKKTTMLEAWDYVTASSGRGTAPCLKFSTT